MQMSIKRIGQLREILEAGSSLRYTDEELASAGMAIVRFVASSERRVIKNRENDNEKSKSPKTGSQEART